MLKTTIAATVLLAASTAASAAPDAFAFSPSLMHLRDGMSVPMGSTTLQGITIGKSLLVQVPNCSDSTRVRPPFRGDCFVRDAGADGAIVAAAPGIFADDPGFASGGHNLGYHSPTLVDRTPYEHAPDVVKSDVHVVITSLPAGDQVAQDVVLKMVDRFGNPTSVTPTVVAWEFHDITAKVVYAPVDVALASHTAGHGRVLYVAVYETPYAGAAKHLVDEFRDNLFDVPTTK
ncbi:hypothetical protein MJ547_04610, partial [Burkholderia gladioli]